MSTRLSVQWLKCSVVSLKNLLAAAALRGLIRVARKVKCLLLLLLVVGKKGEASAPYCCEEVDKFESEEELKGIKKRRLNVVFIGHVGAGKSTTAGQILFLSGQVDDTIIRKNEKEARCINQDSWNMAHVLDIIEEEHVKGNTVDVGRAYFETESAILTILDAPGHKNYVPNMIIGAMQADLGVLVISATKGEFESGYEKGGQTREHVMLAKTHGVSKILVAINKMDHPTVNWAKSRYDEIQSKMVPLLKSSGYGINKDVQFVPISGLMGSNIEEPVDKETCDWWTGPCLLNALAEIEVPLRDPNGPVRMPIADKYKKKGTVVLGRIEYGTIKKGDSLLIMPNKAKVKVQWIYSNQDIVTQAGPAENVKVKLSGIEEKDVLPGFVLCSISYPVMAVSEFHAQLKILGLLDNAILTAGYNAVLHIHSVAVECEILELIEEVHTKQKRDGDRKIKPKRKPKPCFVKNGSVVDCRIQVYKLICIETFLDFPQLGRFTLRSEGETIAVGKVVKLS